MQHHRWALIAVAVLFVTGLLFLAAPAGSAQAAGTCGATYTVVRGDTLGKIAQRCGTTIRAILNSNPNITNPNRIWVGQKLRMPDGGTPPDSKPPAGTTYTVRSGDTLAKIAARFKTTVAAILKANPQITNPNRIYVGQKIVIPGGIDTGGPVFTQVQVFLIAVGTNGTVGCGDSAIGVRRNVAPTQAPLRAAIETLLSIKSANYGESGLYNALYQSSLQIQEITLSGGKATVKLTGQLLLGGVCDNPRVEAQLEQTALQFSTVQQVQYYINGKTLESLLSGQ